MMLFDWNENGLETHGDLPPPTELRVVPAHVASCAFSPLNHDWSVIGTPT